MALQFRRRTGGWQAFLMRAGQAALAAAGDVRDATPAAGFWRPAGLASPRNAPPTAMSREVERSEYAK
jgi:hypothetical protein